MASQPVALYRAAATKIAVGGEAVTAIYGPMIGGFVTNPPTKEAQGLAFTESLWLDLTRDATLGTVSTSTEIQPGQTYVLPPGLVGSVSVNAPSSGHKFSGIVIQTPTQPTPAPQNGDFPPTGPTSLTRIIPSYLYQEYADDEDLQAFVAAYNAMAQQYVDWFNAVGLPVYTGLSGDLLDWVAQGLYGMPRPSLLSGLNLDEGPLNTYAFNTIAYNQRKNVGPQNVAATSDDVFKRIITWNFYKGDGKTLNVRWLKRRIMRFLTEADGASGAIDQTYKISVTFGAGGVVSIRLSQGSRAIDGGAIYGRFGFNTAAYNSLRTHFVPGPNPLPNQAVLKEAVQSGVLQLPFQNTFEVSI